jgi:hypothetical protein
VISLAFGVWLWGFKIQSEILEDLVRTTMVRRKQLMGLQSSQIREICTHLTPSEHEAVMHRGALYGIWVFFTAAGPGGILTSTFFSRYYLLHYSPGDLALIRAVYILPIVIYCVSIPFWLRAQRRFYCSTEWARSHNLQPERLKLFFN